MAKNKPGGKWTQEQPKYDWRQDALRDYEQNGMSRAVAVALGIIPPLPYENISSLDRHLARKWRVQSEQREQRMMQRWQREQWRRTKHGRAGGVAGELDY